MHDPEPLMFSAFLSVSVFLIRISQTLSNGSASQLYPSPYFCLFSISNRGEFQKGSGGQSCSGHHLYRSGLKMQLSSSAA